MLTLRIAATPVLSATITLCLTAMGCDDGVEDARDVGAAPAAAAVEPASVANLDGDTARTAGERLGDVGEIFPDSIYEQLAEVTEAAVSKGNFDDLVGNLTDADQARFAGLDATAVDSAAGPLADTWSQTFNGEFDITDPKGVFRPICRIEQTAKTDDKVRARVTFPAAGNTPEFSIDMVKDMTWHIDVLDNYDRESLRSALVNQINALHDGKGKWPADKTQAQQVVARHVLAAVSNTAMTGGSKESTPGDPR